MRTHAAFALGSVRDARAIGPLLKCLSDEERSVRRAAAWSLGKLGDRRAVEPLIHALEDTDFEVKKTAVEALGLLEDARAVEPLIRVIEGDKSDLYYAAVEALGRLRDARAVGPLIRAVVVANSSLMREHAAQALVRLGEPKWAALIKGESDDWSRLGQDGDPRVVGPLAEVLCEIPPVVVEHHRNVELVRPLLAAIEMILARRTNHIDLAALRRIASLPDRFEHRWSATEDVYTPMNELWSAGSNAGVEIVDTSAVRKLAADRIRHVREIERDVPP